MSEVELNILLDSERTKSSNEDTEIENKNTIKCCNITWIVMQIITGLLVLLWMIFISIMLLQSQSNMHNIIITYIDSSATQPLGTVITPCALTWNNILSSVTMYGPFFFFHFLRYVLTAFIVRNRVLLWLNSILWEVAELIISSWSIFRISWNECWWDSLFFDILLMNALGIECGLLLMKLINWIKDKKCGWWNGIILYDDFHKISNCSEFWMILWFVIIMFKIEEALSPIIFEVTLWTSVSGILGWYRQIMYFGCGFFSMSQLYFLKKRLQQNRLKASYWLIVFTAVLFLEVSLGIKTYVLY
eukprot:35366_1